MSNSHNVNQRIDIKLGPQLNFYTLMKETTPPDQVITSDLLHLIPKATVHISSTNSSGLVKKDIAHVPPPQSSFTLQHPGSHYHDNSAVTIAND